MSFKDLDIRQQIDFLYKRGGNSSGLNIPAISGSTTGKYLYNNGSSLSWTTASGGWPLTGVFALTGEVDGDLGVYSFNLFGANSNYNFSNSQFSFGLSDGSAFNSSFYQDPTGFRIQSSNDAETIINRLEVDQNGLLVTLAAGKTFETPSINFRIASGNNFSSDMYVFGDSMTVPYVVTSAQAYCNLLASHFGNIPVNNQANYGAGGAGRGVTNAAWNMSINFPNIGYHAASIMAGFNDIRRGGTNAKTTAKVVETIKAWVACYWLRSDFVLAGSADPSIVRTGTWTTSIDATLYPGIKASNSAQSTVLNSEITYTSPGNCETILAGFVGGDNSGTIYDYANIEVYLDGVLQAGPYTGANQADGQADATFDNKRTPLVIFFTGLDGSVPHIIAIKQKTSGAYLTVTHFGHFRTTPTIKPLVYEIPYMLTYDGADSQLVTDTTNAAIDAMVSSIDSEYRPVVIKTNDYYNPITGDSGDGHPNATGHAQIYAAALNVVGNNLRYVRDGGIIARTDGYYGSLNGAEIQFLTTTDLQFSTGITDNSGVITVNLSTGKAGSQIVKGGVAASEYLELMSTTHATKGTIRAANGLFTIDDTNGHLGLNNTSPGAWLDIRHSAINNIGVSIKAFTGQTNDLLIVKDSLDAVMTKISSTGGIRVSGDLGNAVGPAGMEMFIQAGEWWFQAYDRNGAAYVPVRNTALTFNFMPSGASAMYINGTGLRMGTTAAGANATRLHLDASTTAKSLMRLDVGVAPSVPNDGDVWREDNTNTGVKIRVNGVTKTITLS